ncbi:hypothetical protein TNCV_2568831 [Trichonephila clavipes]|uniref:Uncharacterized protein n=1 Tax=Trichonephila clavipes TaxID=2585209 RepID=A0A8X6WMW1_TRICX|nr:hypothetical protein TNCV_2568831 [Trichonephila clavipes]
MNVWRRLDESRQYSRANDVASHKSSVTGNSGLYSLDTTAMGHFIVRRSVPILYKHGFQKDTDLENLISSSQYHRKTRLQSI